jgi:hypothetical protein
MAKAKRNVGREILDGLRELKRGEPRRSALSSGHIMKRALSVLPLLLVLGCTQSMQELPTIVVDEAHMVQ